MPVVLDVVCKSCGADYPDAVLNVSVKQARCEQCGERALRASWKRGRAPATIVFRAVQAADGREVDSPEELALRTAKVMAGHDPASRVVFDDDKAAARQRVEEIRHRTWEDRRRAGIDETLMRETDEAAKHTDSAPSALDVAKLNRHGTTDPEPEMSRAVGAEAWGDYDSPRPVVAHDYENTDSEACSPDA